MNEYYKFKGQFKVEVLDKDSNIIDTYEDHNFIMLPARRTIAEMFTNTQNTGLNKLMLGTSGVIDYIPITEENGFDKNRTSLYSQYKSVSSGSSVYLFKNEVIKVGNSYYRFNGDSGEVTVSSNTLSSSFTSVQKPYTYDFKIKSNIVNGTTNNARNSDNLCTISFTTDTSDNLRNTTVTYEFELGLTQGNEQNSERNTSAFSEAGLFINNRLFCMKCFPEKIKDSSTKLRIVWKIIF